MNAKINPAVRHNTCPDEQDIRQISVFFSNHNGEKTEQEKGIRRMGRIESVVSTADDQSHMGNQLVCMARPESFYAVFENTSQLIRNRDPNCDKDEYKK